MTSFRHKIFPLLGIAVAFGALGAIPGIDPMKLSPFGSAERPSEEEISRHAESVLTATNAAEASGSLMGKKRIASFDTEMLPEQIVDDGTRINFNVINWFMGTLGIAAVRPCPSAPIEIFKTPDGAHPAPKGTAGIYADGKYYTSTYQTGGGQVLKAFFYAYDTSDWSLIREVELKPQWFSVYDNGAYNPVDGKIYVLGYDGVKRPYLSELDPETGVYVQLVPCVVNIKAMAFDSKGVLYALTQGGEIETIDLSTGLGTPLFRVDDSPEGVNYWQTIAFDHHTGELFWIHTDNNFHTDLRKIDLGGGEIKKITDLRTQFGATGAWVTSPDAPAEAPATVKAVTPVFSAEDLTGDIRITAPDRTFGGHALTGEVTLKVSVDGKSAQTVKTTPGGEAVIEKYNFGTPGEHPISVVAENSFGSSPAGKVTAYCGIDTPLPVINPTLTLTEGGTAELTWEAPKTGTHGGYIDPVSLVYDIVRYPGEVLVSSSQSGTSFSEVLPADLDRYYYSVTPICQSYVGVSAESNSVVSGRGFEVPLSVQLGEDPFFRLSNIYDLDGDGATFYSTWGAVSCNIAFSYVPHTSDDWFISAPVYLEPGNYLYRIRYMATTDGVEATFTMGSGNKPESQTTELAEVKNLIYADGVKTTWLYIKAETPGNYYFGIHYTPTIPGMLTSMPYGNFKTLDILPGPDDKAPAAVTGLSARAYTKGELKTELTFTVPTETFDGTRLSSVTKIEICDENDKLVGTVTDGLTPGAQASYTDKSCKTGINRYHVYASNDKGRGALAEVEVFVGNDAPGLISGLYYTVTDNRKLAFQWQAPSEVGRNGGYVDVAGVTYDFCRSQLSYQEPFAVDGGTDLKGTTFEYTECGPDSYYGLTQHTYYYGILPKNNVGNGIMGVVAIVCGAPYDPPFNESFPGGSNKNVVWASQLIDGEPAFSISTGDPETGIMPSDGDSGMLLFRHDSDIFTGQAVISPILRLDNMKNPVVSLDVWHNPEAGSDAYISIQGSKNNGQYIPIGDKIEINDGTGEAGWKRHTLSLRDYNNSDRVFIAFLAVNEKAASYFAMDNISVYDDLDVDLAVTEISGPDKIWVNEPAVFTATVANRGASSVESFEIELLAEGVRIGTGVAKGLAPGQSAQTAVTVTPSAGQIGDPVFIEARILLEEDANPENDSYGKDIAVCGTPLPTPRNLTATGDRKTTVSLAWDTPVIEKPEEATEGWEEYAPFAITDQGEWVMVDNDRLMPCGIGGLTYPNMEKGRAFMIWNPTKVNFNQKGWQPMSGEQALIAFASDAYTVDGIFDGSRKSDEWLISPHIAGDTEISFWAKAAEATVERFEVLVSYGTRALRDFTSLSGEVVVSDTEWHCYEFILPADAQYFAIRYISDGSEAFALLIDDLTYTPGWSSLELTGYNVYLDGVRLNDEPLPGTAYENLTLFSYSRKVGVSAVYDEGESDPVQLSVGSGMETPVEDGITVYGGRGEIVINGAYGTELRLFTPDGLAVERRTGSGNDVFSGLVPGLYVLRVGNKPYRLIVR